MKKIIALLAFFASCSAMAQTSSWIDLTDSFLKNPRFDGNSNGEWTMEAWAGSTKCDYGAQEFWNGVWDFHQTVTLPNGRYRISVQAYHRNEGNSNQAVENYSTTAITSHLYANAASTPLKSVYSEHLENNYANGCWPYRQGGGSTGSVSAWFPNTMQSATYCFSQGMYANQLEVEVTDGSLTVGIRNTTYLASNWTIFDNFKLELYGTLIPVQSITMSQTRANLTLGESLRLTAEVQPTNATAPRLTWASNRESVATVEQDGTIRAVGTGQATIYAAATDGSGQRASCTVNVSNNQTGLSSLIINEIQPMNIDQWIDPSWNYGGWIELYNPTAQAVSLTGCWLSDQAANLQGARVTQPMAVPAGGYLNLWFDHHDKYCPSQIDLKLDVEGGTIFLSTPEGSLITQQTYPQAIARCSYARRGPDSSEWGWTATPTPEGSNEGCVYATERLAAPEVDHDSQVFSTTLTVCVNIPEGATLRYTTDGSTPTATHGETSADGLFYPENTTVYRFCLVQEGRLPSPVVTRTYIYKDKEFTLPVFCVTTDNANLFGEDYGILVRGNGNGRPGNGQSTACNWNMDWERPVNFEYLTAGGAMVVNQETDMERSGGWSRAWNPASFKIKANKQHELQNYLPYDFFPAKPYLKHKTLQMRNGGNDNVCRIKDAALQEIIFRSGIDIDCQAYQPAMHYINGRYAGTINVREPNNKHYVYANYGLDEEEIDQFEMSPDSGYVQKCGTYASMQRWLDLAQRCGEEAAYEEICKMVDIDEYCNYMAISFYLGNWDWPQNNVKAFKPIAEGGKYRFVLYDLDGALNTTDPFNLFAQKRIYTFDRLYGEEVTNLTKEIEVVSIFLNMLQNASFRKQFIDTYCLVAGSVFEPSRCKDIINELAARVSNAQSLPSAIYGSGSTPWNTANALISGLSTNRQTTMVEALRNYAPMLLGDSPSRPVTLSSNLPTARLQVNDLPVPTHRFQGTLFLPATLKAQAPSGYKFLGWRAVDDASVTSTLLSEGTVWNHYDQGPLSASNWTAPSYTSSLWNSGQAPLGYGKSGLNTTLAANRTTYYLRTTATLDTAPASEDTFVLHYTADDGFILYVNGTEAARYNMPAGTADYTTTAATYAQGNPDAGTLTLPTTLFRQGENTIAVELHNNSATSTDIYWEASITRTSSETTGSYIATTEEYALPASGETIALQACYAPMTASEIQEQGLILPPVVINEVSAANSINVNEYYKKDDWVELYNTTDEDIDLEGMFLTDDSTLPRKYRLTAQGTQASTLLPAHGYKIVWCSKRETRSELHANFKLANTDGALVRLMAADGSWADSLHYCAHNGDQSAGRYPDGGKDFYRMPLPTIQSANQRNTATAQWTYTPDTPEVGIASFTSRSGGLSLAYTGNALLLKSEEAPHVHLAVYSPNGSLLMQHSLWLATNQAQVSLASLPEGLYVARATDSEGNECATKFIKR